MTDNYVSYQSPSTIIAETVYHFLRGSIYGAAFGLVRQANGSYLHSFFRVELTPAHSSADVYVGNPLSRSRISWSHS